MAGDFFDHVQDDVSYGVNVVSHVRRCGAGRAGVEWGGGEDLVGMRYLLAVAGQHVVESARGGEGPVVASWLAAGNVAERVGRSKPSVSNRIRLLELPDDVAEAMPDRERAFLLIISARCEPCRELVVELDGHQFEQSVVALVPGRQEQASELAALLPPGMRVVVDPEATQLAESLDLESTPFAIAVEGGTVTSKVHLFGGASALLEFVESAGARAENGSFVEISEKEAIEGR